jgi:hypothetical protein
MKKDFRTVNPNSKTPDEKRRTRIIFRPRFFDLSQRLTIEEALKEAAVDGSPLEMGKVIPGERWPYGSRYTSSEPLHLELTSFHEMTHPENVMEENRATDQVHPDTDSKAYGLAK